MFFPVFNPFTFWTGQTPSKAVFPRTPAVPAGTPIEIDARASDPGIQLTVNRSKNRITIRGTTEGAEIARDHFGPLGYSIARGMSFSLDIDRAPTVDVFGRTNYTEKNSRLFTLTTSPGWTAEKCAEMLAAKVNREDDFVAKVEKGPRGSASLIFSRR